MTADRTYGFSKSDAEALVASIGTTETEIPQLFLGGGGGGADIIEYEIISLSTPTSGAYNGLKVASATIKGAGCSRSAMIGTVVDVVDHSGSIFDAGGTMAGYTGWAYEAQYVSKATGAACDDLTPCHWAAINRACSPDTGDYAAPCE